MYPIYQRFVSKVAQSRNMQFEQARLFAKGRVWLGNDARKHGLIDTLGGLGTVISIAKKRIGMPKDKNPYIIHYPKKRDVISDLIASLSGNKDEESSAGMQKSIELVIGKDNPLNIMLKSLPLEIQQAMHYAISVFQMTQRESVLAILPFMPII